MGLSVPLHEGAWAAVIVALAWLAVGGLALNLPVHRSIWPVVLGTAGALLVAYAMFGAYDWRTEAAGFAILAGAVLRDRHLFRAAIGC